MRGKMFFDMLFFELSIILVDFPKICILKARWLMKLTRRGPNVGKGGFFARKPR